MMQCDSQPLHLIVYESSYDWGHSKQKMSKCCSENRAITFYAVKGWILIIAGLNFNKIKFLFHKKKIDWTFLKEGFEEDCCDLFLK